MEKRIDELSIIELKALLYDQVVILEQTNNNIKILQKQLDQKLNQEIDEDTIKSYHEKNTKGNNNE